MQQDRVSFRVLILFPRKRDIEVHFARRCQSRRAIVSLTDLSVETVFSLPVRETAGNETKRNRAGFLIGNAVALCGQKAETRSIHRSSRCLV